jgi:Nucleotidyl transferase AbiEii toxin, Type IV TA system
MSAPYRPDQVIPEPLAGIVGEMPHWFVIGGQAVRCFAPYRPSRDVDFGVASVTDLDDLVEQLGRRGQVELQERAPDTRHLLWNGIKVSVFVLARLSTHVEDRHLDVTGVLASKLHAILDRGLRRDFFDLYVMLERHRLGIVAALAALRQIYEGPIDEGLLLRALSYFDDADGETPLPNEGPKDWTTVKDYFLTQVGSLLTPPRRPLAIQTRTVDVRLEP